MRHVRMHVRTHVIRRRTGNYSLFASIDLHAALTSPLIDIEFHAGAAAIDRSQSTVRPTRTCKSQRSSHISDYSGSYKLILFHYYLCTCSCVGTLLVTCIERLAIYMIHDFLSFPLPPFLFFGIVLNFQKRTCIHAHVQRRVQFNADA